MSFYTKIALFYIFIYTSVRLLSRFPKSLISRLAFSRYGPLPKFGELKSHYLLRWSLYALSWLMQLLVIFACGYSAKYWYPMLQYENWYLGFWFFALPLLGMVALLGALLAAIMALKAKTTGPNPTYSEYDDSESF